MSLALAACSEADARAHRVAPMPAVSTTAHASARAASRPAAPPPHRARPQLDGRDFPDGVLALTYDDGPDEGTLALAEYLNAEHVSATFFVVREWIAGVSSAPGAGRGVFQTGWGSLPVLDDLVGLGHRLGNHTLHHAILTSLDAAAERRELGDNQRAIDPFLTNELRLFRAPAGAWNAAASDVVDRTPELARMVGPIRWDIDRKDWESSLYCRSDEPARECEHAAPGGALRVKPSIVAARYLATIEATRHGIVLFHDRVGHVGSDYPITIARRVIPELRARGFVFAAPILAFSPLTIRDEGDRDGAFAESRGPIFLADVNGDGRADACAETPAGFVCADAELSAPTPRDGMRHPTFGAATTREAAGGASRDVALADVDGDGRADVCTRDADGLACARARHDGRFGPAVAWSARHMTGGHAVDDFSEEELGSGDATLAFGDLQGDGRADVCAASARGVVCAESLGTRLSPARVWLAADDLASLALDDASIRLADVDGDRRADLCAAGPHGVACALSDGARFEPPRVWSKPSDFAPAEHADGPLRFALGDLNGDDRADLCARAGDRILCAFSTGRAFTQATAWAHTAADGPTEPEPGDAIELADLNGDGRADVCLRAASGIACGLAP